MESDLNRKIEDNLQNGVDNSHEIVNKVFKSDKKIKEFFNSLTVYFERYKNNNARLVRVFALMDVLFSKVTPTKAQIFLSTSVFNSIKTYCYDVYFRSGPLDSNIKEYILKWFDLFINDTQYQDLFGLVTQMNSMIDENSMVRNCTRDFNEFKRVQALYRREPTTQNRDRLIQLGDRCFSENNLEMMGNQSQLELFNEMIEGRAFLNKIKKEIKAEHLFDEKLEKVKRYRDELKEELRLINNK